MADEQWSTLTARLKLPAAARVPIENELDLYARLAANAGPVPSETRKKLEHVAALADDLLKSIEELGPEEHQAVCADQPATIDVPEQAELTEPLAAELAPLIKRQRATPRLDALKLLEEQYARVAALRDHMTGAAATIARGKTGRDASNLRALVRRVSAIIEPHTVNPLGKGKLEFDFTRKLCALADPNIKEGTVKGAIEDIASEKLASKNSSNSG